MRSGIMVKRKQGGVPLDLTHNYAGGIKGLLTRWLVLTLAVWVAASVIPGVDYDSWGSLLLAALVLGLLNSFVKPVLVVLSLPFVMLTLGLFVLIINALVLLLAAKLVEGFHVSGFWSAMGAALIVSLVSMFFGGKRAEPRRWSHVERPIKSRTPPPGKGPIIDL
jgi:putative membrane protein